MHTTRPPLRQFAKTAPAPSKSSSAAPVSALSKGLGSLPDRFATDSKRGTRSVSEATSFSLLSDGDVLINSQAFDNESSGPSHASRSDYESSSIALTANSNIISQIDSSSSDGNDSNARPANRLQSQSSLDQEWIVFSPVEEDEGEDDDNDEDIVDQENSYTDDGLERHDLGAATPRPGALTPLAFPAHNGSGSFLDQLNQSMAVAAVAAASENSSLSTKSLDRINAWRINQSQHILNEFTRLEKRNRLKAAATTSAAAATATDASSSGTLPSVDSRISSWGLPEEEDDEDYLLHSHDEIAAALARSESLSSGSLSARSALAVSIIAEELSHILGTDTPFEAAVRLILTAAEEAHQTAQRQDALDLALNAILDPTLSLDSGSTSRHYTSTGTNTPTPASVAAASTKQSPDQQTLWQYIKTKVLYDFIGLNDEILEIILGMRFVDPDADAASAAAAAEKEQPSKKAQAVNISQRISECRQAGSYSEYGNYMNTPSPSPPTKHSYMKVLETNAAASAAAAQTSGTAATQRLAHQVSKELMAVLRQKRASQSTSRQKQKQPSAPAARATGRANESPSTSKSALEVRDFLKSRLLKELEAAAPSSSQQQHYAESVGSSKRCAAGVAAPGSQASTKRARHNASEVSASEASESNYWEMSSVASGNGSSEVGQLIGVW